ncbi:hypothetical protein ACH492_39750 [Streptomyces sp. NPDC019443]|uniref:hypothetical protein n=1 Tax=Streptomyces sp. NPDC019443 TaxID=3365061 RepID=UPI0037B17004
MVLPAERMPRGPVAQGFMKPGQLSDPDDKAPAEEAYTFETRRRLPEHPRAEHRR